MLLLYVPLVWEHSCGWTEDDRRLVFAVGKVLPDILCVQCMSVCASTQTSQTYETAPACLFFVITPPCAWIWYFGSCWLRFGRQRLQSAELHDLQKASTVFDTCFKTASLGLGQCHHPVITSYHITIVVS